MSNTRETTLNVTGMSCGSCVRHVDEALRELEGVTDVAVELRAGRVRVQHDAVAAPAESLITALAESGYPARESAA